MQKERAEIPVRIKPGARGVRFFELQGPNDLDLKFSERLYPLPILSEVTVAGVSLAHMGSNRYCRPSPKRQNEVQVRPLGA